MASAAWLSSGPSVARAEGPEVVDAVLGSTRHPWLKWPDFSFPPPSKISISSPAASLRARQRPGPRSALGRVVFSFPNDDDIYMHDTPSRELFARWRRDFSHGCIRLEDPLALARWLLRDQPEWTSERMDEAISRPGPTAVRLTKTLPVVIFYATVFVDRDGRAHFFEDIYGHDGRLAQAPAHGYPYPGALRR